MSVERFRVQGVEVVLAPGLNLLVCPTAEAHSAIWSSLAPVIAERTSADKPGRDLLDAFIIDGSEWAALSRLCSRARVGEAVIAAGMIGGRRLPAVKLQLEEAMRSVYAPRVRAPLLNRALAELDTVQRELRALGDPVQRAAQLQQRAAAQTTRAQNARAQLERLEAEREALGRIEAVLPDLERLDALSSELSRLEDVRSFPRDGADRLERVRRQAEALEQTLCGLDEQTRSIEQRWAAITRPDADRVVDRISVLLDVQRLWAVQLRALPERIDTVKARRREVERALEKIERGENLLARAATDDAKMFLDQRALFSGTATAVRERIEAEVRRLTTETVSLAPRTTREKVQQQLTKLKGVGDLTQRLGAVGNDIERNVRDRAEAERTIPRKPRNLLGAAPVAIGVVVALALGVLLGPKALPWALGAAVALAFGWAVMRPRHRRALQRWRDALAAREKRLRAATSLEQLLEEELQSLSTQRIRAAFEAGIPENAVPERVEAREQELRNLLAQIERREEVGQQMEAWASLIAQASHEENRARVDRHVAEASLSALERELAADLWDSASLLRKRLAQFRVEEAALAVDWAACARAGELVMQAARRLGVSVREPGMAAEGLALLQASLTEAAREVTALREVLLRTSSERTRVLLERAEVAESRAALLANGGVGDTGTYRLRSQRAERFDQANLEFAAVRARLEAAWSGDLEELRARLLEAGGPRGVERGRARLAERIARLGGQAGRLEQEAARARAQLEQWEKEDVVSTLRAREVSLQQTASDALAAWARDRLALGLVERRLHAWRRAHRTRTVDVASRIFGRLTGGEYVHVRLTGPEDASLVVSDAQFNPVSVDDLPRSARELLYLAFRLASIEGLSTPPSLPLVINTALTGFGPGELRNIARVLVGIADDCQVIVLTRQPRLRDIFEEEGAHALELEVDELPPGDQRAAS